MRKILYVSSPGSKQIYAWKLNNQGLLKLLQIIDTVGSVHAMVMHPDKNLLYVGLRPNFCIIAYKIDTEGKLKQVGYAPLLGSPTYISIDRNGHFMFVASYNKNSLSVIAISNNGLPNKPFVVFEGLEGCHAAKINFSNKILFVPALKQDRIYLFNLDDKKGVVLPHQQHFVSTKLGFGPRHIVFHPNQKYAYSINELSSSIDTWNISNNKIKHISNLDMMPNSFTGTRWGADIHLTSDGRYLYSSDRTASIITIFHVSPDGSILNIKGYQPTETQPRGFNIDTNGEYLVTAGEQSNHVAVYKITHNTGMLQLLGRYFVGKKPISVVFST